jgi:CheY-like chemotaxis protein
MASTTRTQGPRTVVYIGESISRLAGLVGPGRVLAGTVQQAGATAPQHVDVVVHDVREGEGRITELPQVRARFPRAFLLAMVDPQTPMKVKLEAMDAGCDDFILLMDRVDPLPTLTRAAGYHARRYRILVIDDEEDIRAGLTQELWAANFDVVAAADGPTGVSLAWDVDLVLLDVLMPGMDGKEVCRQLRANPTLGQLPIVVLSALDKIKSKMELLDLGANDYITKPYDLDALVGKLRRLLWARRTHGQRRTASDVPAVARPTPSLPGTARLGDRELVAQGLSDARAAWLEKQDPAQLRTTLLEILRAIGS